MIKMLARSLAPAIAIGAALIAAGCSGNYNVEFDDGVPLAELDMSGAAPTRLMVAGPDKVVVTEGDTLDISVSGSEEAKRDLRFKLEDDSLGIGRVGKWDGGSTATIAITMPALHEIHMAGSGLVTAPRLVGDPEVNIAGSGIVKIADIQANLFSLNVMGSGALEAAGSVQSLDYNVAGSGSLRGKNLKVDSADINIAGSGGGVFASDGTVEANIAGSGDVTVYGRANCSVKAMGSGKLNCREPATTE